MCNIKMIYMFVKYSVHERTSYVYDSFTKCDSNKTKNYTILR